MLLPGSRRDVILAFAPRNSSASCRVKIAQASMRLPELLVCASPLVETGPRVDETRGLGATAFVATGVLGWPSPGLAGAAQAERGRTARSENSDNIVHIRWTSTSFSAHWSLGCVLKYGVLNRRDAVVMRPRANPTQGDRLRRRRGRQRLQAACPGTGMGTPARQCLPP